MRPLGLYLHIPFCKAKCIYCDFYSLPRSEEKMDAYTEALRHDLIHWAAEAKDCTVDTIYFGGGTPSYLGADRLCRILETVLRITMWQKKPRSRLRQTPTARGKNARCGSLEAPASTASRSECSLQAMRNCA